MAGIEAPGTPPQVDRLTGETAAKQSTDLATAARAFEGYLVGAMLRVGSRPIGGESPLDGGSGGRMYKELFFEEIARLAAEGPGFGIGGLLEGGDPTAAARKDAPR